MKKTNIRFLCSLIALLFSVIFLNACSPVVDKANQVELVDTSLSVEYTKLLGYYVTVNGTLKNISNKNYTYCSITFNLYNESGTKIGQCMDNTNYFNSGESWQFKAQSLEYFDYDGKYTAKCVDITFF